MRELAVVVVLAIALSGCGDKDLSEKQMVEISEQAFAALQEDLAQGGDINGAALGVPFDASEYGFFPIMLNFDLQIGTAGDMLVTGSFGLPRSADRIDFAAYCNEEVVVVNVANIDAMFDGMEDISIEGRNAVGNCTEATDDVKELLGPFATLSKVFQMGESDLSLEALRQTGDKTFDATYKDGSGETTATISKGKVRHISAPAGNGMEMTVEFTYGDRTPLEALEGHEKAPMLVEWSAKTLDDGSGVRIEFEEGIGPVEDYSLVVFERGVSVPCRGAPTPAASFDLGGASQQSHNGFTLRFGENGDDVLGKNDWAIIQHPDQFDQDWDFNVDVWDTWADASADPSCGIPGPSPVWAVGVLAVAWVGRRYL